jgi:hypothetical protein
VLRGGLEAARLEGDGGHHARHLRRGGREGQARRPRRNVTARRSAALMTAARTSATR